jgi:1-deoxy-D-xylulose-5-phosphate synthase
MRGVRLVKPLPQRTDDSHAPGNLVALRSPAALQGLTDAQLIELADDMRSFLIASVAKTGGHLGAALGVVELTIALHAEFAFNLYDRIVWDVGHQTYPHKILTGRTEQFASLRQCGGISGYPDPAESPYDTVKTGHGGTSISTAVGFALAWRAQRGDPARRAVAVIGDGSLQEGNAYEALNHAGSISDLALVVVLNDNGMAIGPSVGAVHQALGIAKAARAATGVRRLFRHLGFRYFGPVDGHDVVALRRVLRVAHTRPGPVLVHVVTRKGRGYREATPERTCYHAVTASSASAPTPEYPHQGGPTFSAAFAAQAQRMVEDDPRVIVISAAMIDGTGLAELHARRPDRCLDVGMAEQHAVALAAGLALAGQRPVCAIYSTFLQRAYDQLFQDVALQRARVLFCIDRAGLVGSDGATHHGIFDIGYLRCLPNFVLMAPRDTGELARMMDLARVWNGPVAIRYPRGAGAKPEHCPPYAALQIGRAERLADGADGAVLAYGPLVYVALELRRRLRARTGRTLAVINARFAKPLDARLIEHEWRRQPVIFTLEDHVTACGFGAAVAELGLTRLRGRVDLHRLCPIGLPDRFIDHAERGEQLADAGLDLAALEVRFLARLQAAA